jgi:glycosyltransferase involved in cell wall biosynthesis
MSFTGVSTLMPVLMRGPDGETVADFRRAALSVLHQESSLPIELLVIDDGSAQPVRDLRALKDIFARNDVSCLRLESNQGLVFALNAGLQKARYDLIGRVDGDDYWRPGKLQKQIELFLSDSDLTIVGTAMRLVHKEQTLDTEHIRGSNWADMLSFFASTGCPFPHGSILARREIYRLLGGYPHDPRFMHCEDFALWGVWIRFFKAAMLEEVLFEYTVSEKQISSVHAEQQRAASGLVHRTFLELNNFRHIPACVAQVASHLGVSLLQAGKLLFIAWRYYDFVLVEPELYEPVRRIMPDRTVMPYDDVVNLTADRCFFVHGKKSFDRSRAAHVPMLHDASTVASLLDLRSQ